MSRFTKEEMSKFKEDWYAIRESESRIDYDAYRNNKIHRRFVMAERADDISYRKRNKRKNEILYTFRKEIKEYIDAYARRPKYIDEHGKLIFLDEENKGDDLNE